MPNLTNLVLKPIISEGQITCNLINDLRNKKPDRSYYIAPGALLPSYPVLRVTDPVGDRMPHKSPLQEATLPKAFPARGG